ncbi:MAG TPA: hypothetical protein VGW36_06415, partial [Pyrinomonadaceae bacterium]|nr:hypothetical protein [Pyrinomonadaceae bacterium]
INAAKWFWIAFPFVLSLLVLLAPAAEINRVLTEYKVAEEDKIDARIARLRLDLDSEDATKSDLARKNLEYYSKVRSEIYQMRTWPFGLSSSVEYAAMFATNAGAIVWKGIGKLVGL